MIKKTLILYCPECGTERERTYVLEKKQKVYNDDNIEYCDRERCGAVPLKVASHSYEEDYHPGLEHVRSKYKLDDIVPYTEEQLAARREREEQNRPPTEDELRHQAEDDLRQQIKRKFFAANPSASVADFKRLYPTLRDEHLMRAAQNQPEVEEGARGYARSYINMRYRRQ
jgi:hypothetical protein